MLTLGIIGASSILLSLTRIIVRLESIKELNQRIYG